MKSQTCTESDIRRILTDTLKYAPDKVDGGGRNSEKAAAEGLELM